MVVSSLFQRIGDVKKIMDSFKFTGEARDLGAPPQFPSFTATPTPSPSPLTESAQDDDLVRLLSQKSGKTPSHSKKVKVLSGWCHLDSSPHSIVL